MTYTDPVRYPNALEQADPEGALNTYVIDNIDDINTRVAAVTPTDSPANGEVLTYTTANGVNWAPPASGGPKTVFAAQTISNKNQFINTTSNQRIKDWGTPYITDGAVQISTDPATVRVTGAGVYFITFQGSFRAQQAAQVSDTLWLEAFDVSAGGLYNVSYALIESHESGKDATVTFSAPVKQVNATADWRFSVRVYGNIPSSAVKWIDEAWLTIVKLS